MFHFKVLKGTKQLKEYQEVAAAHIGVRFPMEYLEKSQVTAFYDRDGEMKGGYVFVYDGPLRVLQGLPKKVREEFLKEKPIDKIFEITGLWLSPDLNDSLQVPAFWLKLCYDVARAKKPNMIYAYCTQKKGLRRLYSLAGPQIIYRGPTELLEGMSVRADESIECANKWRVGLIPVMTPSELMRKIFKKRTLAKNSVFTRELTQATSRTR